MQALNLLFVATYPPRHGGTAVSLVQLTTAHHGRDRMAAEYDRVFREIVASS